MKGTSKLRSPHLSVDRPFQRLRGCFLGDNAAVPPAYRVKVQKCAGFVDILDVCKFTTFCDRKGYTGMGEEEGGVKESVRKRRSEYILSASSKHWANRRTLRLLVWKNMFIAS